jgi:hypothetical protein
MARRYQNQTIDKTESGRRYYPTTLYSQINPKSDDIYLVTVRGDRMDNLAFEYYGDPSLWWVIASANNIPQDSIFIPVGSQIRVPSNISTFLDNFDRTNQTKMSIFNESFDLGVNNQLKTREQILSSNFSGQWRGILENRPEAYLQYANNKTPFIRLSSGVNVVNPILQKYFGISQPDELATRFILEGGTLASTQKKSGDGILSSQRSNFVGKNSVYGASDLGGTSDFGLRPMPGISGISIKSYGENIATLRIATITLDCYTLQQLEALELLYMRPGYRVLLEWGHTQFWLDADDKISSQTNQAIDIIKLDKTKQDILSKIDDYRNITSYNYDAMLGEIKNYSWDAQTNGSYRCTIEIISLGAVIDSLELMCPHYLKIKLTEVIKMIILLVMILLMLLAFLPLFWILL